MIKQFTILLLGSLILSGFYFVNGQEMTNKDALNRFSEEKSAEFQARKAAAVEYARQNDIPVILSTDEFMIELMYIDEFGQPQYYITQNANAAATISTDDVYPGAGQGFSLDGTGMTVHEWDGGGVRTTHQELIGRVVMGDGVSSTHYHSTHVAGTLIASGVVSSAKGMSPNANLRAFDWNYDESEMADEAANQNALISNHSYGYIRGWYWNGATWVWYGNSSISTQEDYLFGFYESQARDWDQIAYDAPYYLITKSAGNDRGDGPVNGPYPQDGPYDCIGHAGIAKNIMTVGAVNDIPGGYTQPSDVVMSSFSSWGPADDGRIKPDIVTNGVGLYSTLDGSDSQYASYSGTSMATPSAAGSMLLLQQLYHSQYGQYMRAATLKALVIHTADEAGNNPGPDYAFGWGLMNTLKAAQKIDEDLSDNVIDELILSNGGTYQRTVTSDGTTPLEVTIVWTDVPGTPVSASLDPITPMLVNDLDLRITGNASTFYPWKLDRDNPTAAATQSTENNVDNVEKVYIANPVAGDYTIVVDHDGTLAGGSQAFSIVISGAATAPPTPPVADFSASPTTIFEGESVSFTDASTNNPTSWSWNFGDGGSSTQQNPDYTYNTPGVYTVSLTVTNGAGSDTKTVTDYITVNQHPPVADFTADVTTVLIGNPVQFTDLSTYGPDSWLWDFGDGNTSALQNPSHVYNTLGTYTVSLTVTNEAGSDTKTMNGYITVTDNLYCSSNGWAVEEWIESVSFNGTQNVSGSSGTVGYQDLTGFTFNFNPGTTVSVALVPGFNPKNKFEYWRIWIDYNDNGTFEASEEVFAADKQRNSVSGSFTVPAGVNADTRMRISMKRGSAATACEVFTNGEVEDYKVVIGTPGPQAPTADFSADPTSLFEGGSVQFTDLSTENPTSWSWDFGDGGTSTAQNPSYTYNTAGTYTVSLTATNDVGSDTEIKTGFITVSPAVAPIADFSANPAWLFEGQTVDFTDLSLNNPDSWSWDFGDGGTSTVRNPSYTYSTAGVYTVTLTASNAFGSDVNTKVDYITVDPAPPSTYCIPANVNSNPDFISIVNIGGTINDSEGDGYAYYTPAFFTFTPGQNYAVTLTPNISTNRDFWRIWIDFNGDGDFDDSDETLLVANNKKGAYSGDITIPSYASGDTRMRITMKTGGSPSSCEDNFDGETEDYDVSFGGTTATSIAAAGSLDVKVYPNPATSHLNLDIISAANEVDVAIYNLLGQEMIYLSASPGIHDVDISKLEKGIYLVRFNDGRSFINKTFIKR